MIDIETLGVREDAVILSIGAVAKWKGSRGDIVPAYFYNTLDKETQLDRAIDKSTVAFWNLPENKEAKHEAFLGDNNILKVLTDLSTFIGKFKDPVLWCKGTDFDFTILRHAYNQYDIQLPWKYNSINDLRTLLRIFPKFKTAITNDYKHQALNDAKFQLDQLELINEHLIKNNLESFL